MPYIKVGVENSGDIKLHYEDHGIGDPIVLIHGFPFNGAAWEQALQNSFNVGAEASAKATYECIATWMTDFRQDLKAIHIPCLVLQGTSDKILPFQLTGARLTDLIEGCKLVPLDGAPHSLPWTQAEEINAEILDFIQRRVENISAA